jgi:hypothetical protein
MPEFADILIASMILCVMLMLLIVLAKWVTG